MALTATHTTVASGTDAGNGEIGKAQWNEAHTITGTLDVTNGGTGASTLTGLVKGNGTSAFTAAVAGTDYLAPAAIGTTVQGYDADLAAIAALTSAANKVPYATGSNAWALADLTSTGRSIIGAASARAAAVAMGVPYIFAQSGTAASVGAVTTETVLATVSFAGGELGPNGWLLVWSQWSNNNNANNKTMAVRLGGVAGTIFQSLVATTTIGFARPLCIVNSNSQSSQKTSVPIGNTFGVSSFSSAGPTASVNTANAWDLVFTGTKANSGDTLTLESYQVLVCYGA